MANVVNCEGLRLDSPHEVVRMVYSMLDLAPQYWDSVPNEGSLVLTLMDIGFDQWAQKPEKLQAVFLKHGAVFNLRTVQHTLWQEAALATRWLIQQGANIDEQDDAGHTPLSHAVFKENVEAVQLLCMAGAKDRNRKLWVDMARSAWECQQEKERKSPGVCDKEVIRAKRLLAYLEAMPEPKVDDEGRPELQPLPVEVQ